MSDLTIRGSTALSQSNNTVEDARTSIPAGASKVSGQGQSMEGLREEIQRRVNLNISETDRLVKGLSPGERFQAELQGGSTTPRMLSNDEVVAL